MCANCEQYAKGVQPHGHMDGKSVAHDTLNPLHPQDVLLYNFAIFLSTTFFYLWKGWEFPIGIPFYIKYYSMINIVRIYYSMISYCVSDIITGIKYISCLFRLCTEFVQHSLLISIYTIILTICLNAN